MLRKLKSLALGGTKDESVVGLCLHRAIAVAVVSPPGRGSAEARIVELQTETDAQVKSLAGIASELAVKNCPVAVTMPLGSYHLLQIERPQVDAQELVEAARWSIRGMLDYPVEDAVVQVFDAPQPSDWQRAPLLNVVAVPARFLRELTALVKRAGLKPSKVSIVELAIRDLVARVAEKDEPVATVFVDARQGVIQVTCGGQLYLTRRVEYGLGSVRPVDTLATGIHMTLPLELRRTVDYFDSHFGRGGVRRVLVAPAEESFVKFMRGTTEFTGLPVEPLELPMPLRPAAGKGQEYGLPEAYLAASAALSARRSVGEGAVP